MAKRQIVPGALGGSYPTRRRCGALMHVYLFSISSCHNSAFILDDDCINAELGLYGNLES